MSPPSTSKHIFGFLVLILGLVVGLGFGAPSRSAPFAPGETLKDISLHPFDSSKLLAASQEGLYIRDENKRWRKVFSLRHPDFNFIRQFIPHPTARGKVLLVTTQEVLELNLENGRSTSLFNGSEFQSRPITSLALHPEQPEKLYLGTAGGLFVTRDGGKHWHLPYRWPENQPVEFVAFLPASPPILLVAGRRELFFSKDDGKTFESGFSLSQLETEEPLESPDEEEETLDAGGFTSAAFSPHHPSWLWLGTRNGVYESYDGGISWERLSERGLRATQIDDLAFSEKTGGLIAATSRGVFRFLPNEKRWEHLPLGLTAPAAAVTLVPSAARDKETLLAASGNEVFEWVLDPPEVSGPAGRFLPSPERVELFKKLLDHEPTILEIQKAALRYGGLGNGKIQRWHGGSRMRAFIPRLTFGKSLSLANNVDIDRGGTNNPDVFITGPEDIDKGWDLGLTWELGDLLYSSAQPAIDSRAKLLVELRESILSQVTRIYFERRRIQMEIVFSPAESPEEYFDSLLQLDELTAQLDALTDGFFSKEIEKIYGAQPELKDLWDDGDGDGV